ncbi:hypothetical protein A3Q56_07430 [Intoshia linei]|uniref:t-SNARE coiled-coil homology domain-containing protein n=1 Tax=Intoshia linei TaxID=1819745 RepID=A0A177AS75_9BILA|nr:hypothetical protein A3Q56_07430 [Intoshia linei]
MNHYPKCKRLNKIPISYHLESNITRYNLNKKNFIKTKEKFMNKANLHKLEDEANDFVGTALTTFRNLSANYDPKNSLQKSRHDEIKNEFRSTAQELHTLQKKIANNLRKENDKMLDWKDQDDETTKLLDNPNLQKSAAFIEEDEAQLRKLNQEDETIRKIEKDMIDINQVFRDLNNIIHEQGENIDTIESNIEMTEQHVQKADKDLTQGLRHKQKARKNKLICFIIIFIVIVIFSIILYFTFKSYEIVLKVIKILIS